MKRRQFIRSTAATGAAMAGATVPGLLHVRYAHARTAAPRSMYPVVGLADSEDRALSAPAPRNELVTTEQVTGIVHLALDRDTSDRSLPNIVTRDSWVVVKPNIVTCPVTMNDFHAEGLEHWWLVTDLRVVRAVIEYIVKNAGPRRISIAEGPPWYTSGGKLKKEAFEDGWHTKWREFGDLSFAGIAEEMSALREGTSVDIVDLNEDDPVYVDSFDPHNSGIGALQDVRPNDPDGTSGDEWTRRKGIWYPKTVVDCDVLVTVPVLKTHSSAGVTLGMKNLVGCIHSQQYGKGNSKSPIHQGSQLGLVRGVVDLGASLNPDYMVAEGFWATIQQHLGQNGVRFNHNVVVAGGDVVATEAIAMMLMGYHPLDSDQLRLFHAKKIGQWHPDAITVNGPSVETVRENYPRAAETYFARGIRKWYGAGSFRSAIDEDELKELRPGKGEVDGKRWTLVDGDEIIDGTVNVSQPYRLRDCLLYAIPGSDRARKGSKQYLGVTLSTKRKDLCGQLLVGLKGGTMRAFLNGREIEYPVDPYRFDPTPMPFLKFYEGDNHLIIELTKTGGRNDPVLFAASICDLDGDRLTGYTANPAGESMAL